MWFRKGKKTEEEAGSSSRSSSDDGHENGYGKGCVFGNVAVYRREERRELREEAGFRRMKDSARDKKGDLQTEKARR